MKKHELKTINPFFQQLWDGKKTFELRKDDRGFEVGDFIYLSEYDPVNEKYSGRCHVEEISHILRGEAAEAYGLNPGFCILSFKVIDKVKMTNINNFIFELRECIQDQIKEIKALKDAKEVRPFYYPKGFVINFVKHEVLEDGKGFLYLSGNDYENAVKNLNNEQGTKA